MNIATQLVFTQKLKKPYYILEKHHLFFRHVAFSYDMSTNVAPLFCHPVMTQHRSTNVSHFQLALVMHLSHVF